MKINRNEIKDLKFDGWGMCGIILEAVWLNETKRASNKHIRHFFNIIYVTPNGAFITAGRSTPINESERKERK